MGVQGKWSSVFGGPHGIGCVEAGHAGGPQDDVDFRCSIRSSRLFGDHSRAYYHQMIVHVLIDYNFKFGWNDRPSSLGSKG